MNDWPHVSASKLVAQAITEWWGERCPDFDPDCNTCKAWAFYDAALNRPVRRSLIPSKESNDNE